MSPRAEWGSTPIPQLALTQGRVPVGTRPVYPSPPSQPGGSRGDQQGWAHPGGAGGVQLYPGLGPTQTQPGVLQPDVRQPSPGLPASVQPGPGPLPTSSGLHPDPAQHPGTQPGPGTQPCPAQSRPVQPGTQPGTGLPPVHPTAQPTGAQPGQVPPRLALPQWIWRRI